MTPRLEGEEEGAEVVDLVGGEGGGLAVVVLWVAGGEDVADGGSGAVVEVGGGVPEFDQGGGVESVGRLVKGTAGADVVEVAVRVERRGRVCRSRGAGWGWA